MVLFKYGGVKCKTQNLSKLTRKRTTSTGQWSSEKTHHSMCVYLPVFLSSNCVCFHLISLSRFLSKFANHVSSIFCPRILLHNTCQYVSITWNHTNWITYIITSIELYQLIIITFQIAITFQNDSF